MNYFVFGLVIGPGRNRCFGIIATVQKFKDCLLDPYDTELALFVCVLFLVAILKLLEAVFVNSETLEHFIDSGKVIIKYF